MFKKNTGRFDRRAFLVAGALFVPIALFLASRCQKTACNESSSAPCPCSGQRPTCPGFHPPGRKESENSVAKQYC